MHADERVDYNDLFHFNFSAEQAYTPADQPRDPITTEEAIRHIMMRLHVTKVEAPGLSDNSSLPVVHFNGRSRSVDASWDPNANSKIRGSVRLTPEGEVRWTTVSIFSGCVFSMATIKVSSLTQLRPVRSAGVAKVFSPVVLGRTVEWLVHGLTRTMILMDLLGPLLFGRLASFLTMRMKVMVRTYLDRIDEVEFLIPRYRVGCGLALTTSAPT